ncbi:restriction endonuclease subunit S [Stenotrophomonas maltophilia]|uniref:restriction endonuclease subunit S n=1 Tax=Stenotrophomonas maltophilia TaxID=40324 RepID=UPI002096F6AE|nr:restriction endonuclease subunit S [Stenotrophomonas maltophilia]MCO7461479.1 restriction endonuclease subunit S [Stenotrophomonas maltophilia]
MTFPAYPQYKDSGAEWLGEIPQHWKTFLAKRLFINSRDTAHSGSEQLAATQAYGVIPQKDFMEKNDVKVVLALAGTQNFKGVLADDFVISLRSFQGGIEHSAYDGCVSPAYTVLRRNTEKDVCPNLFKYLLKEDAYISALQSVTTGIREGKTITYDQFGSLLLPVADSSEQDQIARFLDHETARIDALIEEQQRLIELLKEKRQAVIFHAVTKGLDPTVPMKDSGVKWLGEVPAHWVVSKFGYISSVVRGGSPRPAGDPELFNGDYSPWVTVAEITKDDEIYLYETETSLTKKGSDQCRVFPKGTLLLSNSGATLGVPKILMIDANANDGVVGFENISLDKEYSYLYLATLTEGLRDRAAGSGQPNLNTDIVKSIDVPIPPSNEVAEIVGAVKKLRAQFDFLSKEAVEGIRLLQERRSALISAAVTGKIDVRGWQSPASALTPELAQEAV